MNRVWRGFGVSLVVLLLAANTVEAKKAAPGPDATQVIVRGRKLVDALEIACQPAWSDPKKRRPVVVIVDATETMKSAEERLITAFEALDERGAAAAKSWRFARLGSKPGKTGKLSDVAKRLKALFSKSVKGVSTAALLRASVKSAPKGAVIVYLADARFEDDCQLETLIKDLRRKKATFSVLGGEAAFGRAWDDGIKPLGHPPEDTERGSDVWYFDDVGRNPFASSHDAPWHGGESAFPGMPYRWSWSHWETAFNDYDWSIAGLGHDDSDKKKTHTEYPLPAAFGPYGLMRAAGVTGGRYALMGWGPAGRRNVKYDYARCNLIPPDLRARADILRDVKRNKYLRATIAAWHTLLEAGDDIVDHTPPLEQNMKTARAIERTLRRDLGVRYIWESPKEQAGLLKGAPEAIEILTRAMKRLDEALQVQGDVPADLRRYEADARLLRHACHVTRFQLQETLLACAELPKDLWKKKKGGRPGIVSPDWVVPGRDPDKPAFRNKPWDPDAAKRVLAERNELLLRFAGTPWGEQVAMNSIQTGEPNWWEDIPPTKYKKEKGKRPEPPPTRPGGGSSGGGPTTGGG